MMEAVSAQRTVLGKMNKDSSELGKALELCPNNLDALLIKIMVEVGAEQHEQALDTLDQYAKYHNNAPLLAILRGILQQMKTNYKEEIE